ncbi:hypothetical protein NDN08_003629 [Rhodosorus marinus]|uniref:Uncharacterized protein n=1 Tax=Rhodosorus marinus TaxID=101924 RepID=A0AAV8V1B9_9RHOD|nr:hypothetical protein NDN08_003629 [Rhodosorus marinus]
MGQELEMERYGVGGRALKDESVEELIAGTDRRLLCRWQDIRSILSETENIVLRESRTKRAVAVTAFTIGENALLGPSTEKSMRIGRVHRHLTLGTDRRYRQELLNTRVFDPNVYEACVETAIVAGKDLAVFHDAAFLEYGRVDTVVSSAIVPRIDALYEKPTTVKELKSNDELKSMEFELRQALNFRHCSGWNVADSRMFVLLDEEGKWLCGCAVNEQTVSLHKLPQTVRFLLARSTRLESLVNPNPKLLLAKIGAFNVFSNDFSHLAKLFRGVNSQLGTHLCIHYTVDSDPSLASWRNVEFLLELQGTIASEIETRFKKEWGHVMIRFHGLNQLHQNGFRLHPLFISPDMTI